MRLLVDTHHHLVAMEPALDAGHWQQACTHLHALDSNLRTIRTHHQGPEHRTRSAQNALAALEDARIRARSAVLQHLWGGWRASVDLQSGDDAASTAANTLRLKALDTPQATIDAATVGWCRIAKALHHPGSVENPEAATGEATASKSLRTPGELLQALWTVDERATLASITHWAGRLRALLFVPMLQGGTCVVQETRKATAIAILRDSERSFAQRISDVLHVLQTLLRALFPRSEDAQCLVARALTECLWEGRVSKRRENHHDATEDHANGDEEDEQDDDNGSESEFDFDDDDEEEAEDDSNVEAKKGETLSGSSSVDELVASSRRGLRASLDVSIERSLPQSSETIHVAQTAADAAADCEAWLIANQCVLLFVLLVVSLTSCSRNLESTFAVVREPPLLTASWTKGHLEPSATSSIIC